MQELCSLNLEELKTWIAEQGEKPFRAAQVFDWVYQKGAESFADMTNLAKDFRTKLSESLSFPSLKLVRQSVWFIW